MGPPPCAAFFSHAQRWSIEMLMEPFLVPLSAVTIAEMGDRTQLLSLMLATRYRQPWSILAGVLLATLANHAAAGLIGARAGHWLTPAVLDGLVGVSMLVMGVWALRPDSLDEAGSLSRRGAFLATLVAFFIAEIGDKTQLVTVSLAAAYSQAVVLVIAGTTAGMLLANAPVVFIGKKFADRLPMRRIHIVASVLFIGLGALFILRAFT
jgi:putative Ca2+/H+ antiporter (TMEM165/GDT1 family)